METRNFVAVDFETMTPELTSACSIGLVKVINGVISQKFYSLIKPIPDGRTERNTHVHGITDEVVADAPMHIPEHTRSLSGGLLGHKIMP